MEESLPELPTLDALESPASSFTTVKPTPTRLVPIIPQAVAEVQPEAKESSNTVTAEEESPSPAPVVESVEAEAPATPLVNEDSFVVAKRESTTLLYPRAPEAVMALRPPPPRVIDAVADSETPMSPAPAPVVPPKEKRLLSLDAFRGFIMLMMASGGLGIKAMADKHPGQIWDQLKVYVDHVQWSGCVPWDLIQPAFMFMVGMAMPFSYAKRLERGESTWRLLDHAFVRSIVLILLGVLCSTSVKDGVTNWTFTNVLSQIGLGYYFLFMLWRMGTAAQVIGFIGILVGYGFWFANEPLTAGYAYQFADHGLQQKDLFEGFFAHWNPHTNAAAHFDQWFLNLFPRTMPFTSNAGGYQTLNFIPSIATMCLGLMIGRYLRTDGDHGKKTGMLVLIGLCLVAAGWLVGENLCPVVKRIWTPSWVLLSGGFVVLMLAVAYGIVESLNWRWLAWPFAIVGMNSLFVYMASQLSKGWIKERLYLHLDRDWFTKVDYAPMIESGSVLLVLWLLCWWLYRQRAFLRI